MSDFGFPTMDDDDRSTASKRSKSNQPASGNGSHGGFSFGDLFNGKTYQPGNRSYNYYGVVYYIIAFVAYVGTIVLLDALYSMNSILGAGAINWVNVGFDIVGRSLIFMIFTAGFILVDRFLLHNSFDLRYSLSRFGVYALYGLIPLALIILYFVIIKSMGAIADSTHSMSMAMSILQVASWMSGVAKVYLWFKWWFWLVPLVIFAFQRHFAFAGRMIGIAGYIVYVILVWIVLWGTHAILGPQPMNMFEAMNHPNVALFTPTSTSSSPNTNSSAKTKAQQKAMDKLINDQLKTSKKRHK